MYDFVIANLYSILTVVLFLIVIGILLYRGEKNRVKKIVLSLVLMAEVKFDIKGSGSQKYAYVIGMIYTRLPWIVKIFITEAGLRKLIEDAVEKMKGMLTCETK